MEQYGDKLYCWRCGKQKFIRIFVLNSDEIKSTSGYIFILGGDVVS